MRTRLQTRALLLIVAVGIMGGILQGLPTALHALADLTETR